MFDLPPHEEFSEMGKSKGRRRGKEEREGWREGGRRRGRDGGREEGKGEREGDFSKVDNSGSTPNQNHLSFYLKVSPKVHASKRTTVQLILVLVSEGQVDLIYQLVHVG